MAWLRSPRVVVVIHGGPEEQSEAGSAAAVWPCAKNSDFDGVACL